MKLNQQSKYSIPVVRAIIQNEHGQILLLKRDNTASGNGSWCLPGGKVDYGQTVEEAVAAEINEELSLDLVDAEFYFFQNSLPTEPGGPHYINFYFHCTVQGDIELNEESSEYSWIAAQDMHKFHIVFRNDEALVRHFNDLTNLADATKKG